MTSDVSARGTNSVGNFSNSASNRIAFREERLREVESGSLEDDEHEVAECVSNDHCGDDMHCHWQREKVKWRAQRSHLIPHHQIVGHKRRVRKAAQSRKDFRRQHICEQLQFTKPTEIREAANGDRQ